jgi:hypothetical protein
MKTATLAGNASTPADAPPRGETLGDLLFDGIYGAAVGGSAIAIFFLITDSIAGQPLFTPSLIGTALFGSESVGPATEIRLDMVALFSAIHFGGFLLLGAGVSLMCRLVGLSKTNPPTVAGVVFVALGAAFFSAERIAMPGVAATIGVPTILSANLVTAVAIALFLRWAHAD